MTYIHNICKSLICITLIILYSYRAEGSTSVETVPASPLRVDFVVTERIEDKEIVTGNTTTYVPEVASAEVFPILINQDTKPVTVITRGLKSSSFARNVAYEYVVRSYHGVPMREGLTNLGLVTLAPGEAVSLEPFVVKQAELKSGVVFSYTVGEFVANWTKCWKGSISKRVWKGQADEAKNR